MKSCVIDASVAAAAFFPEPHTAAARALLVSGCELHAPDLIYAEIANVIWKRRRRGELDEAEAADLLTDVLGLPLRITPSEELLAAALQLAMARGRTVYDCLYVALAAANRNVLITADKRLTNALADRPLGKHIAWIGDYR
jgi:predicted nucleic acid-binding protein